MAWPNRDNGETGIDHGLAAQPKLARIDISVWFLRSCVDREWMKYFRHVSCINFRRVLYSCCDWPCIWNVNIGFLKSAERKNCEPTLLEIKRLRCSTSVARLAARPWPRSCDLRFSKTSTERNERKTDRNSWASRQRKYASPRDFR